MGGRRVRLQALLTRRALQAQEELVRCRVVDIQSVVVARVTVVEIEVREGEPQLVVLGRGPEVLRVVFVRGVGIGAAGVEEAAAVRCDRAVVHDVVPAECRWNHRRHQGLPAIRIGDVDVADNREKFVAVVDAAGNALILNPNEGFI